MHLVEADVVVAVPVDGHGGRAIRQGTSVRNSNGWLAACLPICSLPFCSLQFAMHGRPLYYTRRSLRRSPYYFFSPSVSPPPLYHTSHAIDDTYPHRLITKQKNHSIIRQELPTLYVYDHCPFCVRVRLALGVKNVKHLLHFLANDDVATPTGLVGKKIAPIFVS